MAAVAPPPPPRPPIVAGQVVKWSAYSKNELSDQFRAEIEQEMIAQHTKMQQALKVQAARLRSTLQLGRPYPWPHHCAHCSACAGEACASARAHLARSACCS